MLAGVPVPVAAHTKSLYDDRWESGILYLTGMGTRGDQSMTGQNNRLAEQPKRWTSPLRPDHDTIKVMRTATVGWLLFAPLCASHGQGPAAALDQSARSAIFLFGPAGAEAARQAARIAVGVSRHWLSEPGSAAELRSSGSVDALPLDVKSPAKSIEPAFLNAAREARDADPDTFLNSLDRAVQSLASRPGLRILVTVVDTPPLSSDAEAQLKQTIDFCKANSIRVVVLDPTAVPSKYASRSFLALGEATGGALIRNPGALDATILIASAGSKTAESAYATPVAPEPVAAGRLPDLPTDLPIYTRFVRISPRSSQSFGVQVSVSAGQGGITTTEGGPNIENTTGPMRGLFLVESPLNALHFDIDDVAGTYTARARLVQIARNASGKVVWQQSKLVTLHGLLKKLGARRTGNLYYVREVVLPAGQYTLEATVEDLSAVKRGGVREPLRTSMGTPGFTVSDALVVRPFNGAADKFEADQVFSYDGNAISPVLDPVFRANQPFTLQIYLVIYPDIYGAQPQMSLEILRHGHVVGRNALPFTDKIRNESAEGGGMSMVSEQKHEFPYMATLRGVQLSPGDYEARVTIRQGNVALTRPVSFSVLGNELTAVLASAGAAAPAKVEDSEDAEVTLPEVDPLHLAADAGDLAAPEQEKLWEEAAGSALSYSSRLPNFRCNRETHRLKAPLRNVEHFSQTDTFIEELTYEKTNETYRTLEVNGQKSSMQRDGLKGVHSSGEFGSLLKSIFGPEVAARYKWAGRAMTGGALCDVFDVDVPVERSSFILTFNLRQEVSGFHGRVFLDEDSGFVRRIVLQGGGLPKDFELQSPTISLEYGMVHIAGEDHLLPLRSVLQVRQGKQVVRNETQFRDYRKFDAASEIKFR